MSVVTFHLVGIFVKFPSCLIFRFKYWNEKVATELEKKIPFVAPTRQVDMTITEFAAWIQHW